MWTPLQAPPPARPFDALENFPWSVRVLHKLKQLGITRLSQLVETTREELLEHRQLGIKMVDEIEARLRALGTGFGQALPPELRPPPVEQRFPFPWRWGMPENPETGLRDHVLYAADDTPILIYPHQGRFEENVEICQLFYLLAAAPALLGLVQRFMGEAAAGPDPTVREEARQLMRWLGWPPVPRPLGPGPAAAAGTAAPPATAAPETRLTG